jgi:predicted ATPase
MQLMERRDLPQKIDLRRLNYDDVCEIINVMHPNNEFTDEFLSLVYKETEGNPFFVIEVMKLLREEKTVNELDGIWKLTKDLEGVKIPSKIYDVVVCRLNRLAK